MSVSGPAGPPSPSPDPERVLTQALRAMAGGGKQAPSEDGATHSRLTVLQIVLIAIMAGLLVGMIAGIISLL